MRLKAFSFEKALSQVKKKYFERFGNIILENKNCSDAQASSYIPEILMTRPFPLY